MHTESEAKTKWCPFAVASHTDPRGGFREMDEEDGYKTHPCIASKCMAWRWSQKPTPADHAFAASKPAEEGRGFCGLSGSTTP